MINWNDISQEEQLEKIVLDSFQIPQLIFKHSTRCNISQMALSRMERQWENNEAVVKPYLLDLISYRSVSNAVASKFHITHESPQLLLIKNGKCIYDTSHNDINYPDIKNQLASV